MYSKALLLLLLHPVNVFPDMVYYYPCVYKGVYFLSLQRWHWHLRQTFYLNGFVQWSCLSRASVSPRTALVKTLALITLTFKFLVEFYGVVQFCQHLIAHIGHAVEAYYPPSSIVQIGATCFKHLHPLHTLYS